MGNILFKYELQDAWGDTLVKMEVADEKMDNVRCVYPCVSHYAKKDVPEGKILTLNERQLEEVKNILLKNIDIFDIEKVEHPFVLDGYINVFYFSISGMKRKILSYNISAYREEESVNAKRVLEIFDEICEVLLIAGVDKKYFSLELV